MKMLSTFYVPSGGVETLNRLRSRALRQIGVASYLLYTQTGAGLQNSKHIPTLVSSSDEAIRALLNKQQFDVILVSSDYLMLERLRNLGYSGPLIYEAQGLGDIETAESTVRVAAPYIQRYAQAIHIPSTSHLIELFARHCPSVPTYAFSNVVDYEQFHYVRSKKTPPYPILSWVGRLEANKNWKDYLYISHQLLQQLPNLQLWMFIDNNLSQAQDFKRFAYRINKLNLNPILTIHNNIPHQKMNHYLSATGDSGGFLISTSKLEGFGYSVAEALSCRCPVLCTDSDGVKVFITHNVTGKFYPHHDIDTAVNEGLDLLHNTALRQQIRDQGEAHIKQHFQPYRYLQQFNQMLTHVRKYGKG